MRHKFLIPNQSRGGGGVKSKTTDKGKWLFHFHWMKCPHLILSGYPCGDSCDGGSGVEGNTYYCIIVIVVFRAGCWPRLCPVSGQSVCTCGTQQSPATLLSVYFSHSHNWSDLRCSSSSSLSLVIVTDEGSDLTLDCLWWCVAAGWVVIVHRQWCVSSSSAVRRSRPVPQMIRSYSFPILIFCDL